MGNALGIDGGKSGLRICVRGSTERWNGEANGTFYSEAADDVDAIVGAVGEAVRSSGFVGEIASVCAGLTGMPTAPDQIGRLSAGLATLTGTSRIVLVEDCVIAHYGALAGSGTVVSAGTGTVALAVSQNGVHARRDGWGPIFGDRGSGFDIGRAGLAAAWQATDGVGPATALTAAMRAFIGGDDMSRIQRFYGAPHLFSRVSSFAPRVFEAAAGGDKVALRIVDHAAERLADSTAAASAALDERPTRVSYSGRLFDNALYLERFTREIAERGLELHPPIGDALSGALAIATTDADAFGIYADLIVPTMPEVGE